MIKSVLSYDKEIWTVNKANQILKRKIKKRYMIHMAHISEQRCTLTLQWNTHNIYQIIKVDHLMRMLEDEISRNILTMYFDRKQK